MTEHDPAAVAITTETLNGNGQQGFTTITLYDLNGGSRDISHETLRLIKAGAIPLAEVFSPTTQKGTQHMTQPTLAALRAAHQTIYETTIEFEWESHPHLTEEEAEQVQKIIDDLQAEHKTRANLLTTTRTPLIYEEQ